MSLFDIHLAWPFVLILLGLPWLLRLSGRSAVQRDERAGAVKVPFFSALSRHKGTVQFDKPAVLRRWPGMLIWGLLVLAAARPEHLGEAVEIPVEGRDLMLALDISGSMEEEDFEYRGRSVSRLQVVKLVARDFIQNRQGDRLGLILFGSQAYVQSPLTFDRDTVQVLLHEAVIGLAGTGTSIGDAIGLAIKRLDPDAEIQPVLILLTDGQQTSGELSPLKAAALAQEAGLKIHTVGLGAGARLVRGFFGRQRVNPSRDLDEKTLQQIASVTGGQYFRARDTQGLQAIYAELDALDPVASDARVLRPTKALYYWPLSLAGLLLVLTLAARRISRWQNKRVWHEPA